jgi:anthranilate phosphoribosyltransferase
MTGAVSPVLLSAFLAALRVKGESVTELTGAADAMRGAAVPLKTKSSLIVDCCGTGGDSQGSFNISSAVACVVAGAGYTMAKHGNRSVSSKCGSADLFEAAGVKLDGGVELAERCLNEIGFAFLFAPAFHPAMKHAMPVRRELGARTIFNLLGPLTNPARPQVQLVGVFDPQWIEPVARALLALGCRSGVVAHGQGHDELVLTGESHVAVIESGAVRLETWIPEDFGLKTDPKAIVAGGNAMENVARLHALLSGERGTLRDVVCMNAAALIQAASRYERPGQAYSLREAYEAAENAIERGLARMKLQRLVALTQASVPS